MLRQAWNLSFNRDRAGGAAEFSGHHAGARDGGFGTVTDAWRASWACWWHGRLECTRWISAHCPGWAEASVCAGYPRGDEPRLRAAREAFCARDRAATRLFQ